MTALALGRALLGTALLAAPLAAQQVSVPATIDTLPNGLRVIVHEDHSAPIATVNVWYHVGSGREKPGRTGFAHLFEHLMFMGSQHAPYPQFDRLLEAAGANNNGSTTEDRTNYYESGPSSALALMLWLEADRMGWLLPTMDAAKVDAQRDVVKNERRESVENQPYGLVTDHLPTMLYRSSHPYSWPVIGSMRDLSAASLDDVQEFFRTWYAPNNAVIAVAGAVRRDSVLALVRTYFGAIPRGPAIVETIPVRAPMRRDTARVLEDRVQLPMLQYVFPTVRAWHPDDAALQVARVLLAGAKNARLTRRLVYDEATAAEVYAFADAKRYAGDFVVGALAGPGIALPRLQRAIDEELARLATEGPSTRELEQARNALEAGFLARIQTVDGKAEALNAYYFETGTPDAFQRDLDRLRAVTAEDVQRVVRTYLTGPRAIVSVVPEGQRALAAVAPEVVP
ncbi:MAG TPA: pitrilysin family protein [Gemmatimonadales bacterium]|nr:pitrilysin family protein [Gemmatimonadales bacterium]